MVFLILSRYLRALNTELTSRPLPVWHETLGADRPSPSLAPGLSWPDIHIGNMSYGLLWLNAESGDIGHCGPLCRIWLYFKLSAAPAGITQRLEITNKCNVLCMQTRDWGTRASAPITDQSEGMKLWQWPIRGAETLGKLRQSLTRSRTCGANEDNLIKAD